MQTIEETILGLPQFKSSLITLPEGDIKLASTLEEDLKLSEELAQKAVRIVRSRHCDDSGMQGNVWLQGRLAIKMYRDGSLRRVTNEARIVKHLRKSGVNVPEVHGIYIPSEDEKLKPFFVMERLNLARIDDYARNDFCGMFARRRLREKLNEQLSLVKKAGYGIPDVSPIGNSGVDRHGNVWLHDFGFAYSLFKQPR